MIYYDIPLNKMLEMQKKKNTIMVWKYYEGFVFALLLSAVSLSFNMAGFEFIKGKLHQQDGNDSSSAEKASYGSYSVKEFCRVLGYTSLLSLLTSPFVYPFDTMLRQVQVNGGRGYNNKFDSGIELMKSLIMNRNIKGMYR